MRNTLQNNDGRLTLPDDQDEINIGESVRAWNNALGSFLTKTILAPDDTVIGERGTMITSQLLTEADEYGLLKRVLDHVSKEPVISEIQRQTGNAGF